MLLYRPHRELLVDAMRDLVSFETLDDFIFWYFDNHDCTLFDIRKYSDNPDKRINWSFTMVVSDNEYCKGSQVIMSGWLFDTECASFLEFCEKYNYMLLEFIRSGVHRSNFK